jgi:glycosyltransferase involved in cell wall biosynthesis
VESLLTQDFTGTYEILVVDDCSTDNTATVLEKYRDEPRLRILRTPRNSGYPTAMNIGIDEAKGKYIARMDADGYIRIAGRSKDIIIRGGENIPVVEVEGLLFRHPAVAEVAIVGFPDARLGERACAFVRLREGASLTLPEVTTYLEAQRMARQYMPERLEILPELPRTPSGKIQKFKLREIARAFGSR